MIIYNLGRDNNMEKKQSEIIPKFEQILNKMGCGYLITTSVLNAMQQSYNLDRESPLVTGTAEEFIESKYPTKLPFNNMFSRDNVAKLMDEYTATQSTTIERLTKALESRDEIFKWLLGYYDFPEPPVEGRPRYYWRSHLQDKLKEAGIDIEGIKSPFQPRETDSKH